MRAKNIEGVTNCNVKPFLRWAGGKTWLINQLESLLPHQFNNYHEPFVGGGSVFLNLKAKGYIKHQAFLSDLNEDLINAYNVLKNNPLALFSLLRNFTNDAECYYLTRSSNPNDNIEKAAKFIYLNRTSFNGIYRVNSKGQYNVPFGYRTLSVLFEFENMSLINTMINQAHFDSCDFFETLNNVQENDFIFLDPPYTIAHENNGFIEYNQKIFAWADQIRLKEYIEFIAKKGAYFILTNAAHHSITQLYQNIGHQSAITRYSTIGGKGAKRVPCHEYVYSNFLPA